MPFKTLDRRAFIQNLGRAGALAALWPVTACAKKKDKGPEPEAIVAPGKLLEKPTDIILGPATAPVQVVEYASLTCSHCAAFMVGTEKKQAVFPRIKAKYIDTGKVRWILREYPLNQFDAAAYLALTCAVGTNPERYHAGANLIFSRQQQWAFSTQEPDEILNNLAALMREVGLGRAQFDTCTKDDAALTALGNARKEATDSFKVDSTPTFIINGAKYAGELEFDRFEAILARYLPKG
jgi:protein-disulfide isomerase